MFAQGKHIFIHGAATHIRWCVCLFVCVCVEGNVSGDVFESNAVALKGSGIILLMFVKAINPSGKHSLAAMFR